MIGLIWHVFAGVGLEADQPDLDRVSSDQGFLIGQSVFSSKQGAGPLGEKEAPRNHPEISSQKLAEFECLFRRRILGQYPAAPCSPGPFVLLLICDRPDQGQLRCQTPAEYKIEIVHPWVQKSYPAL